MKCTVRTLVYVPTLLAMMLWGCSGSHNEPAKTTQNASEAQPAPPPPAPPAAASAPARPAPASEPAKKPKPATKPKAPAAPKPAETSSVAAVPPPPPPPPPTPAPAPIEAAPRPVAPPPPPIPVIDTREVTIPAGKEIAVRMIDSVDSSRNQVGETFRASIDSSITVDNQTVIPRGADVVLKLKEVTQAGNLKGRSDLQLELDRIVVGRKSYTVESNIYEAQGDSQGQKAARNVGIGAAIGAAIGAIAGGGKGAAIGAGAGAGGGAAGTAIAKGGQVRVEPETRLMFTLQQPLVVTVSPGSASETGNSGPARLNGPAPRSPEQNRGIQLPGSRRQRP